MAFATAPSAREPLSEINTTPLIDVLLVLLIVLVMAVPMADNSLEIDLPSPIVVPQPERVHNLLAIKSEGDLTWNGRAIDERELTGLLAKVRAMKPEPEVQFRPEANASYDRSARVLLIVEQSRISNFGFVDNEKYRTFGKP